MTPRRTITLAELKAMRTKEAEPPQAVEVPASLKWVGGLALFVMSFFASTLVVLVGYQLLDIKESEAARTTGMILIVALGLSIFAGGILLLVTRSHLATQWLARKLVDLGIGTDAKKARPSRARRRN